jgi:hypothetical protein
LDHAITAIAAGRFVANPPEKAADCRICLPLPASARAEMALPALN